MNKPTLTSSLMAASFLALLGGAPASFAAHWVDVSVVNRNTGERLTPYRHDGKLYVVGTPGDRYAVELKSIRGERVLNVLSVDGVNVVTGETAATLQSGYVIDGGQSHAVNGWRKSMDGVAQFVFTALPESYAARTGRPDNVGVIGVAVYREKSVPVQPNAVAPYAPSVAPWRTESRPPFRVAPARDAFDGTAETASPAPPSAAQAESALGRSGTNGGNDGAERAKAGVLEGSRRDAAKARAASPAPAFKESARLGTGHGAREYSPMRYTEFERKSDAPDEVITLYYDSRVNLIARGIIKSPGRTEPAPFPAGAGFVPDPQG